MCSLHRGVKPVRGRCQGLLRISWRSLNCTVTETLTQGSLNSKRDSVSEMLT